MTHAERIEALERRVAALERKPLVLIPAKEFIAQRKAALKKPERAEGSRRV